MAQTLSSARPPREDDSGDATAALSLLADTHSRTILRTSRTETRSASDLVAACDASRATVYRRVNALDSAGLLTSGLAYDADGHHSTVYEAAVDTVLVTLDADGLAVRLDGDMIDPSTATRVPAVDLLDLLTDEYVRTILLQASDAPMSARELVAACGSSRPTVYRRLDRLEEAGLVETATCYDADGHHRRRFRGTLSAASIRLAADGFEAVVRTTDERTDTLPANRSQSRPRPPAR
jgi:DNA-binding transcriptional ArsR family regulator